MSTVAVVNGDREHKRFSPSQSERFLNCPGSVKLIDRSTPQPPSKHALEGTRAHTVLEAGLLNNSQNAQSAIDNSIHFAEDFDVDFRAAINDALDYIWETKDKLNAQYGDVQMFIETEVNPSIDSAPNEASGYCDVALYSANGKVLYVIDYKHGVGIAKAAIGNSQIKQYAAGFLYGKDSLVDSAQVEKVVLVIIQPRAFHPDGDIREYETTPTELFDYLLELDSAIEECLRDDAPLVPGQDQCRFCPARSICPALEAAALRAVNDTFASVRDVTESSLPAPSTMDTQRLSYAKSLFPLLENWMKAVDAEIEMLLRSGVDVPGYKMVASHPKRQWYGTEQDIAKRLAALIGCKEEDLFTRKFVNITDAESLIVNAFKQRAGRGRKKQAAEEAAQMFAFFTVKESSGNLSLVSDDDRRPAVNKAIQAFGSVQGLIPPQTNEGK